MFGKINFGFAHRQAIPSNIANKQSNNKSQSTNQSSSFLTNPKFNSTFDKNVNKDLQSKRDLQKVQKNDKINSKQHQNKTNTKPSQFPQKTKQIQKNQRPISTNFNQKTQKQKSNENKTNQQKNNNKQITSMQNQIQGSKFRILNQLLYTSSSSQARKHFQQHPQDYETYHLGYSFQAQKWQTKPVNVIIKYFRKNWKDYKNKIICDLGCGEGFLYEELTKKTYTKQIRQDEMQEQNEAKNDNNNTKQVKNKHCFNAQNIKSFDLVSLKPFIEIADISNLPLQPKSVDSVVFCLSLMGKNYLQFIRQAHRILKPQTGQLIIAQVQSRSKNWKAFTQMIECIGFELVNNGVSLGSGVEFNQTDSKKVAQNKGKYFRILHFVKNNKRSEVIRKIKFDDEWYGRQKLVELSKLLLTECIYKKR